VAHPPFVGRQKWEELTSAVLASSARAGIGLALSLVVQVAALVGVILFGDAPFALHAGLFVVWIPAVIIARRQTRDFKQKDFWKAALRAYPAWTKWLSDGFFAYALINFAYFFIATAATSSRHSAPPDAATLGGFTGHWMAFYAAAISVLYSSTRIPSVDPCRQCARGHQVGSLATFCEQCGSPAQGSPPLPPAVC